MDGSLLRVPARMVGEARYGLHSVLGQAAQDISVITDRKGRERRAIEGRIDDGRAYARRCPRELLVELSAAVL
jgi:hypothetical protein